MERKGKYTDTAMGLYTPDPDKPLSKKAIPVAELDGFDFEMDMEDKGLVEDLRFSDPEYKKPSISIKTTGVMKFSEGMCYELMDRGGYTYLQGLGVVNNRFLLIFFYNYESLPTGGGQAAEIRIPPLGDQKGKKKVGEVPMIGQLRRAELSNKNDIKEGDLIPQKGIHSSREFELGSFSFDTRLIDKGKLILVVDTTKGTSLLRGKKISKGDIIGAQISLYDRIDKSIALEENRVDEVEKNFIDKIEKLHDELPEDEEFIEPEVVAQVEGNMEEDKPIQETLSVEPKLFPSATGA